MTTRRSFLKLLGLAASTAVAAPAIPTVPVQTIGESAPRRVPAMARPRMVSDSPLDTITIDGEGMEIISCSYTGLNNCHLQEMIGWNQPIVEFGRRQEELDIEMYLTEERLRELHDAFYNRSRIRIENTRMPMMNGDWVLAEQTIIQATGMFTTMRIRMLKVHSLGV